MSLIGVYIFELSMGFDLSNASFCFVLDGVNGTTANKTTHAS
jgi:hypothetical protein